MKFFALGSRRSAITKFNEMRTEMERAFPAQELTPQGKAEILKQTIGDSLVGHIVLAVERRRQPLALLVPSEGEITTAENQYPTWTV